MADQKHFIWYLNRHYGITLQDYIVMFKRQNGVCAICKKPESRMGGGKRLAVDHCHESSEVRGLLCHNCNVGLGNFRDKADVMLSAVRYLGDRIAINNFVEEESCRWAEDLL